MKKKKKKKNGRTIFLQLVAYEETKNISFLASLMNTISGIFRTPGL